MNSRLGKNVMVCNGSILEYCLVGEASKLSVGQNSFISNCWIDGDVDLKVPDNVCLHTIPVKIGNELRYATIFFDRRDDLKKVYSDLSEVRFLGKQFGQNLLNMIRHGATQSNSIWGLKIFRAYDSMSESFRQSIEFVQSYLQESNLEEYFKDSPNLFYSLFDLLEYRCYEAMISFRLDNRLL